MDNVLRTGDMAIFLPAFGKALVTVAPGVLAGTGATVNAQKMTVCVEGDEKKVMVPGCAYISPPYVTPGVGILKIKKLGGDQLSKKTKVKGKKVMLKGTTFQAEFQVVSPAMQPTPGGPVPDSMTMYSGSGSFQTTNMTVNVKD